MGRATTGHGPTLDLSAARRTPAWLDDAARPAPAAPLETETEADLVVIGGGYAGLWAALRASERDPGRSVLLLEAATCGHAASGRNGGFVDPSLTHGFENGLARWPEDTARLLELGADNLRGIEESIARYGIDCGFERTGQLSVATQAHHVEELRDALAVRTEHGAGGQWLDRQALAERVVSPTYRAGLLDPDCALLEPARLAWGLREACRSRDVRVHEGTPALSLRTSGAGVEVRTPAGRVRAGRVVLATNAYPPLLRRLRLLTVPVYDYALMTEPLSEQQWAEIGWRGREGIGDAGHQFHYYRPTRDGRILFGGYDAIYHFGSAVDPRLDVRESSFALLARHLAQTFPVLEGTPVSHAWGGVIDTAARFCAFYGTALEGRVGYALGYTGLGVAATRFAADVVLDLLDGVATERTSLAMVSQRPVPFPPEPVRWLGVQATRWSLDWSDRHDGRRNAWLRLTDSLGLGFDS